MKVCTDACLFGAAVAERLSLKTVSAVLDIGAGTGLLSLMLAQKVDSIIDAVEIDVAAFLQATENVEASIFSKKISVFNTDINSFNPAKKYDAIISNPPFFEGDLKSSHSNKNAARHDTSLTLQQLLHAALTHLNEDGIFIVLLPIHRVNECIEMAGKIGLHPHKRVLVKQTEKHDYFRGILFFKKIQLPITETEITIKNSNGSYSIRFIELMKDYYLHL